MGLLPKIGSATIFSVLGFFLHKTDANLPFTQRHRRHRRLACVVDTDNETVATSAQQQWEHRHRRYYVNLEKDPSPESTMPVRAYICREYLNDFKGKLEITKMTIHIKKQEIKSLRKITARSQNIVRSSYVCMMPLYIKRFERKQR